MQQGTLGQRSRHLMHALRAHICILKNCSPGKCLRSCPFLLKIQMASMCLIYQKQRPVSVTDIGNGPDIAAHTIIGWTYQKNSLTIRILSESLFHSLRIQASPKAGDRILLRHQINRNRPTKRQPHQYGFVGISCYHDLLALFYRGKHHRFISTGCSIDQKIGFFCLKYLRCQLLCLPDHAFRFMQIIQSLCLCQIKPEDAISCPLSPAGTDSLFVSMPWNLKIYRSVCCIINNRIQ